MFNHSFHDLDIYILTTFSPFTFYFIDNFFWWLKSKKIRPFFQKSDQNQTKNSKKSDNQTKVTQIRPS